MAWYGNRLSIVIMFLILHLRRNNKKYIWYRLSPLIATSKKYQKLFYVQDIYCSKLNNNLHKIIFLIKNVSLKFNCILN